MRRKIRTHHTSYVNTHMAVAAALVGRLVLSCTTQTGREFPRELPWPALPDCV